MSEKTLYDTSKEWFSGSDKSRATHNKSVGDIITDTNIIFEKALCLLWENWQGYIFRKYYKNSYLKRKPNEVRDLACAWDWKNAQKFVAEGFANGCYGFTKDPVELKRLADLGSKDAQKYVAEGLAEGHHGFTEDPVELKHLAYDLGWWRAQDLVADGLAIGCYRIERDPTELMRLAYQLNWTNAQKNVAEACANGWYGFAHDPAELRYLAYDLKWGNAQKLVAEGLANGCYGFTQDLVELKRIAYELRWKDAQSLVAKELANGDSVEDLMESYRLADLGWSSAQYFIAKKISYNCRWSESREVKRVLYERGWRGAQNIIVNNRDVKLSPTYPQALTVFDQQTKDFYSDNVYFVNKLLDTIPSMDNKLAFGLHMACLQQSRKG